MQLLYIFYLLVGMRCAIVSIVWILGASSGAIGRAISWLAYVDILDNLEKDIAI